VTREYNPNVETIQMKDMSLWNWSCQMHLSLTQRGTKFHFRPFHLTWN